MAVKRDEMLKVYKKRLFREKSNFDYIMDLMEAVTDEISYGESYSRDILKLPEVISELYCVVTMDGCISGDGFHSYFENFTDETLIQQLKKGLVRLKLSELLKVIEKAEGYKEIIETTESLVDIDDKTGDIHGLYFREAEHVERVVVSYLLKNKKLILSECEA